VFAKAREFTMSTLDAERKLTEQLEIIMHGRPDESKRDLINAVRLALIEQRIHEREACAAMADDYASTWPWGTYPGERQSAMQAGARIAAKIRSRSHDE